MNRLEWRYFILAALLHLSVAAWLLPAHPGRQEAAMGTVALWDGDTFSYLDPVENLLRTGTYAQDLTRSATYAGRMPGYGLVYGLLRLALAPGHAANVLVGLQLLLSLVALYCLARLAQLATRQPAAFRALLLLYGLNTFVTVYDIRLLTESFATSALIIGLFELAQGGAQARPSRLLRAGGWLAWAVFLRPFLAPLLGVLAVVTVVGVGRALRPLNRPALTRALRSGLLLLLPFLLADLAWMGRNWPWYHRPVGLQSNAWAGYRTAPGLPALAAFIGTIGEEPTWWNASSDIAWFYQRGAPGPNFRQQPRKLAPPAYTYDSLVWVRQELVLAGDSAHPLAQRRQAEIRASLALSRYTQAYRRLRPWQAGVLTPLRLAARLTLAHPADNLYRQPFAALSTAQKAVKAAAYLAYLVVVGLGLLGTLLLGWQQPTAWLVKLVPAYLLGLLCLVLQQVEFRYFVVAYPFVLIGTVQLLLRWQQGQGHRLAPRRPA